MDVALPASIYILVIDTTAYSGNFEHEICGYCTGIVGTENQRGRNEASDALLVNAPLVEGILAKGEEVVHHDWGLVAATIRATPSRCNDGHGRHLDTTSDGNVFPAYESVAIFLSKPLTEEEMAFVRKRADDYAAHAHPEPFVVRDVYQLRHDRHTIETRI